MLKFVGLGAIIAATVVFGFLFVRGMRKNMMQEMAPISEKPRADGPNFPLATYQGVIANLKEREKELKSQLATQSNNLGQLETLNNMVLENIPTGVLMF